MKKSLSTIVLAMAAIALIFSATQCNNEDGKKNGKAVAAKTDGKRDPSTLPNYRYIDSDSVLKNYNLAKDYSEEMTRMQANLEATMKQRESALNNFAAQVQQKIQNNQYLNEQQYNADQQKAAQMQQNAQNEIMKMQNSMAQSMEDAQKIVQDSVQSFIKDYNAKHGYDAILYKNATLYIDPALDITQEVIEGLNARYNKKSK